MNVVTRRPVVRAASGKNWREEAACSGQPLRMFYSDSESTQQKARSVCRGCPVLETCLTDITASEVSATYQWGVVGGLTGEQRRALRWEVRLHGRPDLEKARLLVSPRWRYELHRLRCNGYTPDAMAEFLRIDGLIVDPVTVRLAVWWLGGKGARVRKRSHVDGPETVRLVTLYGDVIQRLRALGASHRDVAAYLGVDRGHAGRAVQRVEAAAEPMQSDLDVAA